MIMEPPLLKNPFCDWGLFIHLEFSTEDKWLWIVISVLSLLLILISESKARQWMNIPELPKGFFSEDGSIFIYDRISDKITDTNIKLFCL